MVGLDSARATQKVFRQLCAHVVPRAGLTTAVVLDGAKLGLQHPHSLENKGKLLFQLAHPIFETLFSQTVRLLLFPMVRDGGRTPWRAGIQSWWRGRVPPRDTCGEKIHQHGHVNGEDVSRCHAGETSIFVVVDAVFSPVNCAAETAFSRVLPNSRTLEGTAKDERARRSMKPLRGQDQE